MNKYHGWGFKKYGEGSYYDGEWVKGIKCGFGTQLSTHSDIYYEGTFKQDHFYGIGFTAMRKLIQWDGYGFGHSRGFANYYDGYKNERFVGRMNNFKFQGFGVKTDVSKC